MMLNPMTELTAARDKRQEQGRQSDSYDWHTIWSQGRQVAANLCKRRCPPSSFTLLENAPKAKLTLLHNYAQLREEIQLKLKS